jgi:hypothetical protein
MLEMLPYEILLNIIKYLSIAEQSKAANYGFFSKYKLLLGKTLKYEYLLIYFDKFDFPTGDHLTLFQTPHQLRILHCNSEYPSMIAIINIEKKHLPRFIEAFSRCSETNIQPLVRYIEDNDAKINNQSVLSIFQRAVCSCSGSSAKPLKL